MKIQLHILELSTNLDIIKNLYKTIYSILKTLNLNYIKLSVSLVNIEQIKNINLKYRYKKKFTNIISFSYTNNIHFDFFENIGDIIICHRVIVQESKIKKKSENRYIEKIILHGILHLLSFDHKNYFEYEKMNKMEKKIYLKIIRHKNNYR